MTLTLAAVSNKFHQTFEPFTKRFLTPRSLSRVVVVLPATLNQKVVDTLSNQIFKSQLAEGDFDVLQNRLLQLNILDAEMNIGISFNRGRLRCVHFARESCVADATLAINCSDAIRLISQEVDPDTLFFQRRLKISGDTELAHHIKNTVDTLNPEMIPNIVRQLMARYRQNILNLDNESIG